MHKAVELKQKRAALIGEVRKIQEAATSGILSANDLSKIAKIEEEERNLVANIELLERQEKREAELRATDGNRQTPDDKKTNEERQLAAFNNFLKRGVISPDLELRDMAADTANVGGNIVAPQQFVARLIAALKNLVWVRQYATVLPLGSFANLGVPTLTADVADADWTTEVAAVTADTSLTVGKRTMAPNILSKLVKVSMKLMEVGAIPPSDLVADRLAYKFAVTEEKAFLTGDGTGKPLGLFTANASGISTGRDYSTGNTATAIVADNLYGQIYNVAAQYRKNAKWIFHRDAVSMIRKLKDSQNRYLWEPSVQAGQPDTLAGYPLLESEYAPNTFTTGLYVGIFGDLSQYWICDQLNFQIQRLNELYAANNQIGFIGRKSTDGAPVLEAAFSRVKLG